MATPAKLVGICSMFGMLIALDANGALWCYNGEKTGWQPYVVS